MDLRAPPSNESPKRAGRSLGAVIALQGVLIVLVGALIAMQLGRQEPTGNADRVRKVASQLKAGGALDQAAELYERYIDDEAQAPDARAKVAYSVGTIYLEQGRYERALRWFYEAEALGAGELQQEVGEKIVHSLERLGRVHAARAALAARTQLEPEAVTRPTDDPVVARLGNDEIHASDLQRALDDLPPQVAEQFSQPAQRETFLRKYVADELIWRKAQKLEYDEDPDVRRRLNLLFKQLVIEAFVGKEILGKIEVDPADLKTYHAANRQRYDQKQAARLRILKVASEKTANSLLDQLGKGASFAELAKQHSLDGATRADGGLLPQWVERGDTFLPGGDAAAISDAVFALGKGETSKPIVAGKHVYLVQAVETRPAKSRPFDEVAKVVERDYRMMKTQTAYQDLITQELSAGDVELLPENLTKTK